MTNNPGNNRPFHRTGKPGGPACPVKSIEITVKAQDGSALPAYLLDGGAAATELELLRTVASGMGIRWGHHDLGWWAAVPRQA